MTTLLNPNYTPLSDLSQVLRTHGHAVLAPIALGELIAATAAEGAGADEFPALPALQQLRAEWAALPIDAYLRDGGRYRRRRHASFIVDGAQVTPVAHRAHWQPLQYNALHGGLERWFEPMLASVIAQPVWNPLLRALSGVCSTLKGAQPWFVEAHQFRIDTTDGIGRPTPEGAHRDGVDFVAVLLVERHAIKGGETRVFEADGPAGQRFTMTEPWTTLLLDDARVVHESTPIQPLPSISQEIAQETAQVPAQVTTHERAQGHRDTLVLTFRSGGFQNPAPR